MQETTLETFKYSYNTKLADALDWITSNEPGPVPLFIQEILTNAEVFHFYGIILNGGLFILVCLALLLCYKIHKDWTIIPFIPAIILFILCPFFFLHSLYHFIQINYAPKI